MFCGRANPPYSTNAGFRGRAACQMLQRLPPDAAHCCTQMADHFAGLVLQGAPHAPPAPAVVRPWEGKNAGSSFFSLWALSRESSAPASWAALLSLWLSSTSLGAPFAAVSTILAHYRRGTAWCCAANDAAGAVQSAENAQPPNEDWMRKLTRAGWIASCAAGPPNPVTQGVPCYMDWPRPTILPS